jgi:predicted lipoprotein with Yx(FWY)xxD motif
MSGRRGKKMRRSFRAIVLTIAVIVAGAVVIAGCGGDDDSGASNDQPPKDEAAMKKDEAAIKKDDAAMKKDGAAMKAGTTIALGESEFGTMLFDSKDQAIYVFERDPKGASACYGECAAAWPPVFTKGEPKAGDGIDTSLLGTVKRRDGKLQVTYADRPLYFYAHERPGEVKCHNVNLNGGLWWVVGPDGEPRA